MTIQDNNTLYEATLTNHTPAMIGGANQGWININGSIDYPRPTDIAGKTRWWLRSIISAGIYEQYNKGIPINQLDKIAGELLGHARPPNSLASKIIIEIKPEDLWDYYRTLQELKVNYRRQLYKLTQKYETIDKPAWHKISGECLNKLIENNGECPEGEEACCALASSRVLLGIMGKSVEETIGLLPIPPEKIKLKVRIRKRIRAKLNDIEERILGLALGLALYASGIGRAQTRGYGKLKPLTIKKQDTSLGETINQVYIHLSRNKYGWKHIAEQAVETAVEYIEKTKPNIENLVKNKNIPMAYTLHPKAIDVWSGRCPQIFSHRGYNYSRCQPNQTWCITAAISQAVTKQYMKVYLASRSQFASNIKEPQRLHGYPLITMYLGMERSFDKGFKEGYFFRGASGDKSNPERMISPLFFTPLNNRISALLFIKNKTPIELDKNVQYYSRYYSKEFDEGMRPTSIKNILNNIYVIYKTLSINMSNQSLIKNFEKLDKGVQLLFIILDSGMLSKEEYEKMFNFDDKSASLVRLRFLANLVNTILGLEKILEGDIYG